MGKLISEIHVNRKEKSKIFTKGQVQHIEYIRGVKNTNLQIQVLLVQANKTALFQQEDVKINPTDLSFHAVIRVATY